MQRIAVCPGSFDPVTFGHLDIITRASKIFDNVIVLISVNAAKNVPSFTVSERVTLVNKAISATSGIDNVVTDILDGLLADYVKDIKNSKPDRTVTIIKGLRAVSDFEYEFQMALANKILCPDVDTMFLTTASENMYLSSSVVKNIALFGGDISYFVPGSVLEDISRRLIK
ncbi:MAG: pantetheine-phosphate adenylyltransferase [Ruminococcus sp.]|jgi:pantetheine-phosphate adenylyltransferase|nr:pantetheine-phosphate adenylyltransferase [Ruminococcus sp.]